MVVGPVVAVGSGAAAGLVANTFTHDAGRAAAIAVIGTGAVTVAMFCARWMWRAALAQMKAEIREATGTADLEASLGKKLDDMRDLNDAQHADTAERLDSMERRLAVVETNTEVHAERLDNGSTRMDQIITTLDRLQSAVAKIRKEAPDAA